jgi:hypothetical protein
VRSMTALFSHFVVQSRKSMTKNVTCIFKLQSLKTKTLRYILSE